MVRIADVSAHAIGHDEQPGGAHSWCASPIYRPMPLDMTNSLEAPIHGAHRRFIGPCHWT